MPKLLFAADLALPLDAATQTIAFIGRKRSGKTYAAGKLVELLLEQSVQTVILDTVGNWYGLSLNATGKTASHFDLPIFGGLRGDIALNPHAGQLVADVLADTGRSAILDVSQFTGADRKRFATGFGECLWQRKKAETHPTPIHLVIEECQLVIPQFVGKDETRMVGIYEQIVRLGGNYGVGVSMITQRPQSVNKEALTQTECLMCFQTNGVPERKAIREWVTHQGLDVRVVDDLPGLPVGTCWLWSPQWLEVFVKTKVLPKVTFDASSTPKVGEHKERRNPAPLDLRSLSTRMAALIEEAKANDPRELRKQIADLQKQLRDRQVEVERVEVPVLKNGQLQQLSGAVDALANTAGGLKALASDLLEAMARAAARSGPVPPQNRPAPVPAPRIVPRSVPKEANGDFRPSGPQQRILDSLAWLESVRTPHAKRTQLALLADQSPTSSAFSNNLGAMRTAGLIDYPTGGFVCLTNAGRNLANLTKVPRTTETLHMVLFSRLAAPQIRILKSLINMYPESLDKEELAVLSDQSYTSSAYLNNLGSLRSLGLIDYPAPGRAVALPVLFLD